MPRKERWKRIGDDSWAYNKLLRLRGSEDKFLDSDIAWMEGLPASDLSSSAYYAGTLPEVVIRPLKDNAVYKANYMIPNKELRNQFYNSIGENYDSRLYINRLWNLYNKSNKPNIKSVQKDYFNAIPLLQKFGIMNGDENRAHYSPFTNTMYVDPNDVAEDIEAEMSHAYQINGTDTPRSWKWMKQFLSRPNGDFEINGKSGYDTPGSLEHVAHSIIQPAIKRYLTDNYDYNSSVPEAYKYDYDYNQMYRDIYTMYNNMNQYFKPISIGPRKGYTK